MKFFNGTTTTSIKPSLDEPLYESVISVALSYGRKDVAIEELGRALDDVMSGLDHERADQLLTKIQGDGLSLYQVWEQFRARRWWHRQGWSGALLRYTKAKDW